MFGPSYRWTKSHAILGTSTSKTQPDPLCKRAIQGHSGARIQQNFFSQQSLEIGCAKEHAKYEKKHERKDSYEAGFDQNKGRQAVHFTLVNPLDRHANKKYEACAHFKSHHDAIYVVDMEGAQKNNLKFYQTVNDCVVRFDTIPRITSKRSSTSGSRY